MMTRYRIARRPLPALASAAALAFAFSSAAAAETLPFETASSLAAKVEVSEPTVGRFCRAIGYDGFKDLKKSLKSDMGDAPWLIGDRLRDLQARTQSGQDQLSRGLELEMAALVSVYETAQRPDWRDVVRRKAASTARSLSIAARGFPTPEAWALSRLPP